MNPWPTSRPTARRPADRRGKETERFALKKGFWNCTPPAGPIATAHRFRRTRAPKTDRIFFSGQKNRPILGIIAINGKTENWHKTYKIRISGIHPISTKRTNCHKAFIHFTIVTREGFYRLA